MGSRARWGLAVGAVAAPLLLAAPLLAADLGRGSSNRGGYAGEPRFHSRCTEQGDPTLLGCLPQTVYGPPVADATAWNQLSAFGDQRRPYPTLSPWAN